MEIDLNEIYDEAIKELPEELIKTPATTEEDDENLSYTEEELLETLEDDFAFQIKQRGMDYYDAGNVIKVVKTENDEMIKYTAKIEGSSAKPYEVIIEVDMDGIDYSCSCPCTYPCKHEYAVLMAIDNQEYETKTLKPAIKEKEVNIKSVLATIPANELKKYILDSDNVRFNAKDFENHFRKYYPNQKYDYYYNNLYNAMIFETGYEELINNYFKRIKQYISGNDFMEVFKIIKSIINAYHDSKNLNIDDYFTDILPNIGMYLRVAYRKSGEATKHQIVTWMDELEKQRYYDNYYLEDIIKNVRIYL